MESIDSLVHFTEYPYAEGNPERIVVLHYPPVPPELRVSAAGNGGAGFSALLQEHLDWIYGWGYTPISLKDYRLFLRGELHLPKRPVIMTFDTGMDDVAEADFHPLFESGGRGVLFVMTGRNGSPWSAGTEAGNGAAARAREPLRRLHGNGLEIGSLTCTNRPLPLMAATEREEEVRLSKTTLEEILEEPVVSLAYPSYAVHPDVKRTVIKAGYEFAVGGPESPAVFGTDLYEIRRIRIPHHVKRAAFALNLFAPGERWERLRRKSRSFFQRGATRRVSREAAA